MFDLVMLTFFKMKVLNEEKKREMWNLIVNYSVESLDKHDRDEGLHASRTDGSSS